MQSALPGSPYHFSLPLLLNLGQQFDFPEKQRGTKHSAFSACYIFIHMTVVTLVLIGQQASALQRHIERMLPAISDDYQKLTWLMQHLFGYFLQGNSAYSNP